MKMLLLLVLLFAATCIGAATPADHEEDRKESPPHSVTEGDVIRELLHHRGDIKHGLPHLEKPLTVFITLYLSTVTKVNLEDGYVEMTGYMTQIWDDPRLRFQYSPPFHNIQMVRLPTKDIWMPDIELYEVAPPGVKLMSLTDHVTVSYNGTVRYYPFVTMPVFCDVVSESANESVALQCQLKFGSWSYHDLILDVDDRRDFDLMMTYKPRGPWVVTSIAAQRNEVTIVSLQKTYADVTYNVTVARLKK